MDDRSPPRRNLGKRLMAGAAWAFGAKICGMGSSLVVNALLARMLEPDELGAYFLTVSITAFAAIVASFGLRQTVVRLIAESLANGLPGRARTALSYMSVIAGLGAIIVALSYHLAVGSALAQYVFEIPLIASTTGLTALWIVALTFQSPVAEIFRGLHDIRLAVFLDGILANMFLAGIVTILHWKHIDLNYGNAILVSVLAASISLTLGLLQVWRRRHIFQGDGTIGVREVLSISAPLFVTNLANYGINQFSLWIVAAKLPAADVALFGAAWRLVSLVTLPLALMNMNVNPVIAELHTTRNKESLQNALRGTATVAAVPALLVLLGYMIYSAEILQLVYGEVYLNASPMLLVLSIGMLANVWTGSCSQVLAMTGHQRFLMNMTVISGVIASTLAFIAVDYWGLIGVAAAVTIGRIVNNVVGWLAVYKLTGLWTHGTLRPAFIRMAIMRVLEKRP